METSLATQINIRLPKVLLLLPLLFASCSWYCIDLGLCALLKAAMRCWPSLLWLERERERAQQVKQFTAPLVVLVVVVLFLVLLLLLLLFLLWPAIPGSSACMFAVLTLLEASVKGFAFEELGKWSLPTCGVCYVCILRSWLFSFDSWRVHRDRFCPTPNSNIGNLMSVPKWYDRIKFHCFDMVYWDCDSPDDRSELLWIRCPSIAHTSSSFTSTRESRQVACDCSKAVCSLLL